MFNAQPRLRPVNTHVALFFPRELSEFLSEPKSLSGVLVYLLSGHRQTFLFLSDFHVHWC